jgi:hypothetical protein
MTKKRKQQSKNPNSAKTQGFIKEVPCLKLRADVPVKGVEIDGSLIIYEEHFPDIREFAKYTVATDETFKAVLKGLAYTAVNALFLAQMGVKGQLIIQTLEQSQLMLEELLDLNSIQFSTARVLIADGFDFKEAVNSAKLL